jgi:hypothetical protein
MPQRLARTWDRNPNHVDCRWSKVRWRREGKITRGLAELGALVAGMNRLVVRHPGDGRLAQIANALGALTPEGLGLLWYEPTPRGGGKARGRWYIPDVAQGNVSAALALVLEAYRLLARYSQTLARETRRMVAQLAAAVRREGLHALEGAHPHPATGRVSLTRDSSCSSGTPGPEWLQRYARHAEGATPHGAM